MHAMSNANKTAVLRAEGLGHQWDGPPLFQHLQFVLPAGVTLVSGDEQTGKTTLLRILAGEVRPTHGWVEASGQRPGPDTNIDRSLVFRTDPLNAALDQIRVADWYQQLPSTYPGFNRALLDRLTEAFGLAPHLHKPMYMLSAGSRRKVWLSAAFASGAPLLLIDQPFAALDVPSIRLLREVLQDLAGSERQACVIADYEAPEGVELVQTITL